MFLPTHFRPGTQKRIGSPIEKDPKTGVPQLGYWGIPNWESLLETRVSGFPNRGFPIGVFPIGANPGLGLGQSGSWIGSNPGFPIGKTRGPENSHFLLREIKSSASKRSMVSLGDLYGFPVGPFAEGNQVYGKKSSMVSP